MKTVAFALLLGCGGVVLGQAPMPVPPGILNPGKSFQFSPGLKGTRPQFKLQIPDGKNWILTLPGPVTVKPQPQLKSDIDPGMVRKPHGFVQRSPSPAQSTKLYPDLRILPIEIAQFDPAHNSFPELKGELIPINWPNAKLEPIPINWDSYRLVPIGSAAKSASTP